MLYSRCSVTNHEILMKHTVWPSLNLWDNYSLKIRFHDKSTWEVLCGFAWNYTKGEFLMSSLLLFASWISFFPLSPFATTGEHAEEDKLFPYIVKGMFCSSPLIQGIVFKRIVTDTFLQCCLSLNYFTKLVVWIYKYT